MIQSFASGETEAVFAGRRSRRLPADIQPAARRKLMYIDTAVELNDLRVPPGNRLEALQGDRAGQHSIRVNDQRRICLSWGPNGPADLEIVDYH